MDHSILIQIHHIFMKITTSINSGGDIHLYRQCIMDVLSICALLFGQTEGILEKYCILSSITGWHFSAKVSTKVLRKN